MKKSMLTVFLAVSAVMAFAVPAEMARVDVYNLSQSTASKSGDTAIKIADKGTAAIADSPEYMVFNSAKAKLSGRGAKAAFKIDGTDWQTGTATFTAVGRGSLDIRLMGPWVLDPQTKKPLEAKVDFKKLVVNGKTVYEGKKGKFVTVWNAKPYRIQNVMSVKDGDTVKIEVTFRPTQEER